MSSHPTIHDGVMEPLTFTHNGKEMGGIIPIDHELVEEVAIRMCLGLGLHPFEHTTYEHDEAHCSPAGPAVATRMTIAFNGQSMTTHQAFMHAPLTTTGPRWMGFKRKASEAIAAWNAVHAAVMGS